MGYVWCDGYVWDMCGVRYANNLLKNPATKRLSGKKTTPISRKTCYSTTRMSLCLTITAGPFKRNGNGCFPRKPLDLRASRVLGYRHTSDAKQDFSDTFEAFLTMIWDAVGRPRLHRFLDPGVLEDVSKHLNFL